MVIGMVKKDDCDDSSWDINNEIYQWRFIKYLPFYNNLSKPSWFYSIF